MVLEHACSQTPEQLGCLRASGEEKLLLSVTSSCFSGSLLYLNALAVSQGQFDIGGEGQGASVLEGGQ